MPTWGGGRMLPPAVHILRHGQGSLPSGSCVTWRLTKELLFCRDSGHQRQAVSGEMALWPNPTLRWSSCSTSLGGGFCTKRAGRHVTEEGGWCVEKAEREASPHTWQRGQIKCMPSYRHINANLHVCMVQILPFLLLPTVCLSLSFSQPKAYKTYRAPLKNYTKPHHQQCHGHYLLHGNTQPWIKHMPHYTFQLKVNLSYWHAASNSIKAKWNTGSI